MSGASSRRKGATFERALRAEFGHRVIDYTHVGTDEPDMIIEANVPDQYGELFPIRFAVEAKNQKTMSLPAWWRQACTGAADDEIPVLVVKRNGTADPSQSWVVLNVTEFQRLLDELEDSDQ